MSSLQQANQFIEQFTRWASGQADILAVALVGSHARNVAREDSDVDLVILTNVSQKYLAHDDWSSLFGVVSQKQIEDYGRLTSLRVWYESGLEVEYGFTTPAWAETPLDEGTRKVIEGGMRVLFERQPLLSMHEK
jgi:predicted nucleotidyltransferase